MKRKLLSILVASLAFMNCSAASNDTEPVIWGLKANLGLELPGNWRGNGNSVKMYSTGTDFQLGAVANVYLGRGFYFEPGVSLFYDSYKYDDLGIMGETDVIAVDPAIHKFGFRVPLVFGYTLGLSDSFSMSFFTGPQLSYALWGEVNTKYPYEYSGEEFPTDLFGVHGQRRFDFGWKLGVGFPINNFLVSVEGEIGISDMLRSSMSFRENRCTVGLTYYF